MKRSFLTALGLEKAQIDQIMDEHGSTIEALKEKYDESAEKLKGQVKDLQAELAAKPADDGEDWEGKYNAEVEAHSTTKSLLEEKEAAQAKSAKLDAVIRQLEADGANPKAARLMAKEFDLNGVELDGETVKGWEEHETAQAVKAEYKDFFGTTETRGAQVATPPANVPGAPKKTLQELMQEANQNPGKIDEILAQVENVTKTENKGEN